MKKYLSLLLSLSLLSGTILAENKTKEEKIELSTNEVAFISGTFVTAWSYFMLNYENTIAYLAGAFPEVIEYKENLSNYLSQASKEEVLKHFCARPQDADLLFNDHSWKSLFNVSKAKTAFFYGAAIASQILIFKYLHDKEKREKLKQEKA